MRKNLPVCLLLQTIFCINLCTAQDWRSIRTEGAFLFSNDLQDQSVTYRVDSVWVQGNDTVLMSFPVIQQLDINCFSPTEASWIGRMTVVKPNGDNVFINYSFDSLVIRTTAAVNDSWQLCNTGSVVATVTALSDTLLFGLHDSIKVISLNSSIAYIDDTKIILSKHYGLISMPDFFHFPDDPQMNLYSTYSLIGISNPNLGVQNLTRKETFSYHVGDEFHRYNYNEQGGFGNPYQLSESWAIYTVLEKIPTATEDTLKYRFERCMKQRTYYSYTDTTSEVFTNTHDTIDIIHLLNTTDALNFDQQPGTPVYNDYHELYEHNQRLHPSGLRGKSFFAADQWYTLSNPLCWSPVIVDGCIGPTYYYDGIFGPDFSCDYWTYSTNIGTVYYKKDGLSWGTPYSCEVLLSNEFNEEAGTPIVSVSPNPVTDHIDLSLKDTYAHLIFELYNLTGNVVIASALTEPTTTISCNDLQAGLYLYRITAASGVVSCGKLAVQ